jgi:APA family basic amino acid/polyamine antiporter
MMTMTYALTVGAVFILRRTRPDRPRPYLCTGYPWLPAIYIAVAIAFVISTLLSRPGESMIGLGLACLGIPLYLYRRQLGGTAADTDSMH